MFGARCIEMYSQGVIQLPTILNLFLSLSLLSIYLSNILSGFIVSRKEICFRILDIHLPVKIKKLLPFPYIFTLINVFLFFLIKNVINTMFVFFDLQVSVSRLSLGDLHEKGRFKVSFSFPCLGFLFNKSKMYTHINVI